MPDNPFAHDPLARVQPEPLDRALKRALAESELLNAIATTAAGEDDLERMLVAVLQLLGDVIQFTGGSIALVESQDLVIRAACGPFAQSVLGQHLGRGASASWQVIELSQPIFSNDLIGDGLSPTSPIRSILAVPLVWRGQSFGLLEVDSTQVNAFTAQDLSLLQKVAAALSGPIELAQRYAALVRAVAQAEKAERRLLFLSDASKLLAGSLDYETTLSSIARLAVPFLADWCSVDILDTDGKVSDVAHAHADPAKEELLRQLRLHYPVPDSAEVGVPAVLRSGQSQFVPEITDAAREPAGDDLRNAMVRALDPRSLMIIPLAHRGRMLGAISFVLAGPGRRYSARDLELAEEMGRRAALSIENALLYREAQQLNRELEQRILHRTAQLQTLNDRLAQEIADRRSAQEQLLTSNQELHRLASHLQSAREEERRSMARDIHDQMGQVLSALKIDMTLLNHALGEKNPAPAPAQISADVASMLELVDQAIKHMREILMDLRPQALEDLGLISAIEWQAQEFQERTHIECLFRPSVTELDLDPDRSIAVFRVIQEALTNVARHAGASRVEIELEQHPDRIEVTVRDNGRGLGHSDTSKHQSFGILGMKERALVFGGQVSLSGRPGEGTEVCLRVPLPRA